MIMMIMTMMKMGENDWFPQISKAIGLVKKGWGRGARIRQSRSWEDPMGHTGHKNSTLLDLKHD